jgi:hypothetical protein
MARRLAEMSGDDQSLDDIVDALCGCGPLIHHSGNQLAHMLLRHLLATHGNATQRPQTGQGDVAGTGDAQRHGQGVN